MSNAPDEKPPTTLAELFPSKWLHADDLGGNSTTVTISAVELEKFPSNPMNQKSEKVWRACLHFMGKRKVLICNVTQATAVSSLAGSEVLQNWVNTRMTLHPARADNGKPTIAIKSPPPRPATPELDETDANDLFFEGAE